MKILEYKFPKITDVDLEFNTFNTDKILLSEAEKRGMGSFRSNKWVDRFEELFYKGGSIELRTDIPRDELEPCLLYFKALARSFAPKHEHKVAVCSLLLSGLEGGENA